MLIRVVGPFAKTTNPWAKAPVVNAPKLSIAAILIAKANDRVDERGAEPHAPG